METIQFRIGLLLEEFDYILCSELCNCSLLFFISHSDIMKFPSLESSFSEKKVIGL